MKSVVNKQVARCALAAAVGALLMAPYGAAVAMQETQSTVIYHEVPDYKLDGIRGKFISGNQILFFGVEMYSQWKTALGDSYTASLRMGIDRSHSRVRPTVTVMSMATARSLGIDGASGQASSGQISSGGLDQVKGVSQAVQVTGSANGVGNAIAVDVGTQRPAGFDTTSSSSDGNHMVVDNSTGAVAQTFVGSGHVGVAISVPGQGVANQAISSMIGMQQRAQVFGDMNSVNNRLNLMIQIQTNTATAASRVGDVLQNVRGLTQAGMF